MRLAIKNSFQKNSLLNCLLKRILVFEKRIPGSCGKSFWNRDSSQDTQMSDALLPPEFSLLFNLLSRTSILLEGVTIKMIILIRILVLKRRICYLGNLERYKTITVLFEDRNPNCFMFWLLCCEYNKFSIDSGIQSQLFVSLSLPIKAWKFSGNLSDDEHVSRTASQVLWNWGNIYSNMLISNQENPAKFSSMEINNGVNLKNWWI